MGGRALKPGEEFKDTKTSDGGPSFANEEDHGGFDFQATMAFLQQRAITAVTPVETPANPTEFIAHYGAEADLPHASFSENDVPTLLSLSTLFGKPHAEIHLLTLNLEVDCGTREIPVKIPIFARVKPEFHKGQLTVVFSFGRKEVTNETPWLLREEALKKARQIALQWQAATKAVESAPNLEEETETPLNPLKNEVSPQMQELKRLDSIVLTDTSLSDYKGPVVRALAQNPGSVCPFTIASLPGPQFEARRPSENMEIEYRILEEESRWLNHLEFDAELRKMCAGS